MSLSHRYRNFGGPKAPEAKESDANVAVSEDQQLEAFEKGYQAGWDDAVKAQADSVTKISAEFGQNLQDMSFTYNEALSKLTLSLKPVLTEIVDKLLPDMAQRTLGPQIVDQLMDMIKQQPHQPIEIVVAPSNVETIQSLAEDKLSEPFEIVTEPSLGDGQAFVRIGEVERSVDLEAILSGVREALTAFFHETEQETDNG
ncbi:FliH/SctL family protein [Roseobacter sinensis]|uniref:ABC transporter ATP-binding protein n=1 Tax=Roseobacter sinensis TaxID=2931391 RepID=A0ABT3B8I3_9RHOB|nr:ABC transporter ATP-binding protein [Roseobacter sp. WL0113]MCV3269884.1 ABC transporter ATP-binding protein [Roseobacter sp. WL0113]